MCGNDGARGGHRPLRLTLTACSAAPYLLYRQHCYDSPRWFDRELDRVFTPSWTLMGREDEVSEPGEYLATDTEWGGQVAPHFPHPPSHPPAAAHLPHTTAATCRPPP